MYTINCAGKLIIWDKPVVIGIINATPDSFHDESRSANIEQAMEKAGRMIAEGVSIVDIGGQSTRPGAVPVGPETESQRVIPVIRAIHEQYPAILISVDTYYASVASAAVAAGAQLINDISAGLFDADMLVTVASLKVPYICMHHQGSLEGMHQPIHSDDIALDIFDFFIERIDACKRAGIHDVIIDPGFGFGKTIEDNFNIIRDLPLLAPLGKPILLGVSRKSSIYKTLGGTAATALNGTTVLNTIGLMNGASILRVHDVKEAMEAIQLVQKIRE